MLCLRTTPQKSEVATAPIFFPNFIDRIKFIYLIVVPFNFNNVAQGSGTPFNSINVAQGSGTYG